MNNLFRISCCVLSLTKTIVLLFMTLDVESFSFKSIGSSSGFRGLGCASSLCYDNDNDNDTESWVVALTREEGKNEKLKQHLLSNAFIKDRIRLVELPCIEHSDGTDYDRLRPTLMSQNWDYVAVTSPEAARVLASVWDDVVHDQSKNQKTLPRVAAVGKATESMLNKLGIDVSFCPSKATALTLAKELPFINNDSEGIEKEITTLLYPASAKAKLTLQNGLADRGFNVTRLDTYDTVTATWSPERINLSSKVDVVCFASPSSVKGWVKNTENDKKTFAACIGETSAQACRENKWSETQIFYPEKPGIEGWVDAVSIATEGKK